MGSSSHFEGEGGGGAILGKTVGERVFEGVGNGRHKLDKNIFQQGRHFIATYVKPSYFHCKEQGQ